ncbi:ATP-dependent acyl-CoA ligase [soil metagenome]
MSMYSGIDDPRDWVMPRVIEEQAITRGDDPVVSMVGGDTLSWRDLSLDAARVAGFLAGMGVGPGDRVAIMLPNSLDFIRAWAGVGRLGATAVLLNTELMGGFLAHPLADSAPRILIIEQDWLPRLDDLQTSLTTVEQIIVVGRTGARSDQLSFGDWQSSPTYGGPFPAASDIACIMYTSGTTGVPKGVLMPYAHCFLFGLGTVENIDVTEADHYYICLPMFHANGLLMQLGAVLIAGASATVRERFSASVWLEDIRDCGATLTNSLGAISAFVVARPEDARDRKHRLRAIITAPNHPDHARAWQDRFGVAEVVGGYGMTECNIPLYSDRDDPRPGTCGKAYAKAFEVEIRDPDTDLPVPEGEVGEIMVRPLIGQAFMAGYNGLPEKTVEAWRNLWFHSGDAGRMAADGYVTFVDRIKDCIRRRGENISAVDIEVTISQVSGVAEVAAYAVPSEVAGAEDEIMLAVVCAPGATVVPADIVAHARARMPRFAQPRYVEFMDALPKTGTEKVRKAELRKAGITSRTLDLTRT